MPVNTETRPGRGCPLSYRYSPSDFNRAPQAAAETLYVIGGLYGNVEALDTILVMKQLEERQGHAITLFFNGDFNWFNVDSDSFAAINETVMKHGAIQGNVEAELTADASTAGCGCAYPAYVCETVVERSNRIMEKLRAQADCNPRFVRQLATLPMHATIAMGNERIGIVHGDPESLAGWSFAVENPVLQVDDYFRQAQVRAFCSSHTCLPFAQDFDIDGRECLVINNGAAGMPNFRNTHYGLMTRVSIRGDTPENSLYGITLGNLRFDAIPIPYDQAAWLRRFNKNWPPGSPADQSYFQRIIRGPDFDITQAIRGRILGKSRKSVATPQPTGLPKTPGRAAVSTKYVGF